ncbi:hypothetical protein R3I94_021261 [Phoxinus phoxinus]|uniref:Uncharacterized protein n=1 Tax=Phoxinus phoxinus TaxID=58324 RepID=A0AAN9GVG0_9TELE
MQDVVLRVSFPHSSREQGGALAALGVRSGMKHEQRRLQLYRQEVKLPHLRLVSFTVLNIKKQFDSF